MKNQIFRWFVLGFALCFVLACKCDKTKLINTWVLEKYGPEAAPQAVITTDAKPEILLEMDNANHFTGTDGCNAIFGVYNSPTSCGVRFDSISTTLIFCPDEGIMDQATAITTLLRDTRTFRVSNTQLTLCTSDKRILQYRKK